MELSVAGCLATAACRRGRSRGDGARSCPAQVRPGELFELRVEMERADYARFELQVPPHGSLHRVAVESVPVRLEGGRYRQRETLDAAGRFIRGDRDRGAIGVARDRGRDRAGGIAAAAGRGAALCGSTDESAEPVGVSGRGGSDGAAATAPLVVAAACRWWRLAWAAGGVLVLLDTAEERSRATSAGERGLEAVLADLERADAIAGAGADDGWSAAAIGREELREAVEAAVYAGRGEAATVAAMLRKEVAR